LVFKKFESLLFGVEQKLQLC